MPPITIDGTDVSGITIDGTEVTEVTVDGDVVFAPSAIPDSGVARWTFDNDDTESGTALDIWNNNDGTINGATTGVTGEINEAYSFDGTDDWVDVPNGLINMTGTQDFTITAWVNIDSSGSKNAIFAPRSQGKIILYASGSIGDPSPLYAPMFSVYDGSHNTVYEDVDIANDGWQFLAAKWDVDSGMAFYRNGSQKDTNNYTGIPDTTSAEDAIGQRGDGVHHFDGGIDDVRLYNKALTDTEISNLYNNGSI